MKSNNAIGISINGNTVKAAFLTRVKGKIHILGLQSTKLPAPLENLVSTGDDRVDGDIESDLEKAFDIKGSADENIENEGELPGMVSRDRNVSLIYSLLDKFKDMNTKVGVNAPVLTIKYEMVDTDSVPKTNKKLAEKMGFGDHQSNGVHRSTYERIGSEKSLRIEYEHHPPILDLLDEVNQFRKGNLRLELMDTNELALAFMAVKSYKLKKDYATAIIYVEPDFSRVIFLQGRKILHITPIIHKGSMSKDVLHATYSKIVFAQDHHFVPELDKIILASRCAKLKAKVFFKQKFPSVKISYFNSKLVQSDYGFDDKGRLFSQYAIPIAFAWKILQKKSVTSRLTNLLPEYILERRAMPKLAVHGYILLTLLAITAFSFTYLLVTKNMQIYRMSKKNRIIERQIENNQPLAEKVKFYDEQIYKLERNIALVDSFSHEYDQTYTFLSTLNKGVRNSSNIWISKLAIDGKEALIQGIAKDRNNIPVLSEAIGGASLKKVTRAGLNGSKVFEFELDKSIGSERNTQNLELLTGLTNGKSKKTKASNGTAASNGVHNKKNESTQ